jgi:hypothetical protein
MCLRSRKHTVDANFNLKIIYTTFYQQQPHKYFNLIIFIEFLIKQKLRNFRDVQLLKLPEDDTNVSKHVGVIII